MKRMLCLLILLALTGCGWFGGGPKPDPGNPLAVSSCPENLPPLTDPGFGATVTKLVDVAAIYHKCRAAAVGQVK